MKPTYKTFIRSCKNWYQFAKSRKITQHTGLTYDEAKKLCAEYNQNRTARQISKGTMMEFTSEE